MTAVLTRLEQPLKHPVLLDQPDQELPAQPTLCGPAPHIRYIGSHRYFCINDGCDGIHHVWCSCRKSD